MVDYESLVRKFFPLDDAGGSVVSDEEIAFGLSQSEIPDVCGRWPAHEDWEPTYDTFWAAGIVAKRYAISEYVKTAGVKSFNSEGTSVTADLTFWETLADKLFAQSTVIGPAVGFNSGDTQVWIAAGVQGARYIPRSAWVFGVRRR